MNDDRLFRFVLAAGLLVLAPLLFYNRRRSCASGERLDLRPEGALLRATIRFLGPLTFIGLVVYLIDPSLVARGAVTLPNWVRVVGLGMFVSGGLLVAWTFHHLGTNLTDTVVTRREHRLVTTGPYRWVRHPFYVAAALIPWGATLAAANWFLMMTGTLALALLVYRTSKEEELLVARFGEDYRRYAERTGRFWPRWRA